LERAGSIDSIVAARDNDDLSWLQLLADGAANLKAIRFWHQQIAQDQLWSMPDREIDSGIAVFGFQDLPIVDRE
jgi:hypothetical protein